MIVILIYDLVIVLNFRRISILYLQDNRLNILFKYLRIIIMFLIKTEMTFYAITIMIIFWYFFMCIRFIN